MRVWRSSPSCDLCPSQGYAYVPHSCAEMVVSLVCNRFRARLSEELVVSAV